MADVSYIYGDVKRFSGDFQTFVERFMLANRPCIFDKNLTDQWKARKLWQKDGSPDFHYLMNQFDSAQVPVADCTREQFSTHPKRETTFSEFVHYWKSFTTEGSKVISSLPEEEKCSTLQQHKVFYLKDWHFVRAYPEYGLYEVPDYFCCDWLNEVWDLRKDVEDDYRFVYMGPAGSWTPFHADVFRSYSWSANVCGRKEWLFLPPGAEQHLKDSLGNLPFDITSPLLKDDVMYPNAGKAPQPIRVLQEAGEVIFVPSGWFHQVRNLEDTISINHNWTNAFGLKFLWAHLQAEMKLIQKEIADCKEMEGWAKQCQIILKASAGMDYKELYQFLYVIATPRLKELDSLCLNSAIPTSTDTVQESAESTAAATSLVLPFFYELRKYLSKANLAEFSFFACERGGADDTVSPPESGSRPKLHSSLKARDDLGNVVKRIMVPNPHCDHTGAGDLHAMDSSHLVTSNKSLPFPELFLTLPDDVKIALKCIIPDTDSLQFSLAVFRAFELCSIWTVLQELLSSPEFEAI